MSSVFVEKLLEFISGVDVPIFGLSDVATQIFFAIFSAFVAAATLLSMQTKYRHVRLLRGLEQEIKENLSAVTEAGIHVFENEDTRAAVRSDYSNEIFVAVRSEAPLLYIRLVEGFSPISRAYRGVSYLQTLEPGVVVPNEDRDSLLSDLERTEANLLQASEKVKKIQRQSWAYRVFNRVLLKEDLTQIPGLKTKVESDGNVLNEVVWRPSGMPSHERKNAILESVQDSETESHASSYE